MTDAPQCPEGCGPFGVPGHPESDRTLPHDPQGWPGWVWCAACGYLWESDEDYALAVRAQDEYLELEGVKDAQERQDARRADDCKALADWEAWAAQHA